MSVLESKIAFMKKIADEAGQILCEGFGSSFTIKNKEGIHNLVTEYDQRSEDFLVETIKKHYPNDQILTEESGTISGDKTADQWIIDPLDGTVNFAHQIPIFAVSIALIHKTKLEAGVVLQPKSKELFWAQKGKGAFLGEEKLKVSSTATLEKAFLATGFPYNLIENPHHCIEKFLYFLQKGMPIRRIGVAALDLAYVAAGKFDGFFESRLAPWDCAAGILLVEEAGGKISGWKDSDYDLLSYGPILASNTHLHAKLYEIFSHD